MLRLWNVYLLYTNVVIALILGVLILDTYILQKQQSMIFHDHYTLFSALWYQDLLQDLKTCQLFI